MKLLLTLFLFFLFISAFNPDDSLTSCPSPFQCSRDLRTAFFADALIDSLDYSFANPDSIPRNFHDVSYDNTLPKNCNTMDQCLQDTTQLRYRVYYPSPKAFNYQNCKLPLVLLFHGGSFSDCNGTYKTHDLIVQCRAFARRGFIAVTCDYRLGALLASKPYDTTYTVQQMLSIWRGGQDGRGGLRSMIAREIAGNEPYRFDTSKIFIGGNSAGSVLAMNIAYYNKTPLLNAVYPGIGSNNVLGSITQKYYYGSDTIKYSIKGVLNEWGGVLVPQTPDSQYLKHPENFFFAAGNSMPPMIAFLGKKDPTFNYMHEALRFTPTIVSGGLLNSTNYCLNTSATFTLSPATPGPDGFILGSQDIYEMLIRKSVGAEMYIDSDMGHGLNMGHPDFGLSSPTQDSLLEYFVERACTFFQAVINNKVSSLDRTKFSDCENYRNKCDTLDNNNGCTGQ